MEGRLLEDRSLVVAAKAGDMSAYEQLVRAHQATALRVAYLVTGDKGEAEDITQDAFINAYRALPRFDEGRPFRPWLLTIVRNLARNRRRRSGRQAALRLRVASLEASGEAAPSPEDMALSTTEAEMLLAAVDALPEKYRLVIGLRYLVGLSERETAETLDVPVGTVKSRTARALDQLKTDMTTSQARNMP